MPKPLEIKGQIASEGFATGPLWSVENEIAVVYEPRETPEADIKALADAISAASVQTAELMGCAEGDAADILEFQLAMLEDGTFSNAAFALIMSGLNADIAWRNVLQEEIAGYEASDDEYFSARAADLRDVEDRVLSALTGAETQAIPPGSIYLADDIAPSVFLAHDWTGGGIALKAGSGTGHVAMLARQRGVPTIVSLGDVSGTNGSMALLDAEKSALIIAPSQNMITSFQSAKDQFDQASLQAQQFAGKPASSADGTPVKIMVNIADPAETESIPIQNVDGVGLMRTEFLFGRSHALPSEDVQFAAYKKVLDWAGEKPVIIRTVDAGGDKPIDGFTSEEANPFLGVRGIRLALKNENIFSVQIRALLRAGVFGNLKVMLPMVAIPEELDEAVLLFEKEAAALTAKGIENQMPEIGIMVEVPSVAILPERFSKAAFFSIGSNDLTQYVLAASRDNGELAYLAKSDDPSVLSLVEHVASYGQQNRQDVSLCGDAASDPPVVPKLLACGLRTLSVAAARIGLVKSVIANVELQRV